ncbi:hypothetical protein ACJX0J_036587, partial [Zea mays]
TSKVRVLMTVYSLVEVIFISQIDIIFNIRESNINNITCTFFKHILMHLFYYITHNFSFLSPAVPLPSLPLFKGVGRLPLSKRVDLYIYDPLLFLLHVAHSCFAKLSDESKIFFKKIVIYASKGSSEL